MKAVVCFVLLVSQVWGSLLGGDHHHPHHDNDHHHAHLHETHAENDLLAVPSNLHELNHHHHDHVHDHDHDDHHHFDQHDEHHHQFDHQFINDHNHQDHHAHDHDHDHDHHQQRNNNNNEYQGILATGREAVEASEKINQFFRGIFDDNYQVPSEIPTLREVPAFVSFNCDGRLPGYYADVEHRCQLYHVCTEDYRRLSFICPNGTTFHQAIFACDWWFNHDCNVAQDNYHLNSEIYKDPEPKTNELEQAKSLDSTPNLINQERHDSVGSATKNIIADILVPTQHFQVPSQNLQFTADIGLQKPLDITGSQSQVIFQASPFSFDNPGPDPFKTGKTSGSNSLEREYLPPNNDYLPPTNDYLPPTNDYLPPQNDYLPPTNEYLPPN